MGWAAPRTAIVQHVCFEGTHQGGDCEQGKGGDDGLGRRLKLLEDGLAGGQLCAQRGNEACGTKVAGGRMGVRC